MLECWIEMDFYIVHTFLFEYVFVMNSLATKDRHRNMQYIQ